MNPPLPPGELLVWDCIQSDAPRFGCPETFTGNTAAIGIIGGADGPVAIFIGAGPDDKQDKNLLAACSSLHFEPAERVEWRMVFHIASDQKVTMQLLP